MPVARSRKVTSQIIVIVYINSNMKTLGVQSVWQLSHRMAQTKNNDKVFRKSRPEKWLRLGHILCLRQRCRRLASKFT